MVALFALCCGGLVRRAAADDGATNALDTVCTLQLASQPLDDALRELARQAHLQLMFEATVVANLRAPAIDGRLTPRTALQRLLAHTDLYATEQAPGVVVVRRRPSP